MSLGRAGEGNMNCTVRVTTTARSVIVKQSRPWVEKYPQFAAPGDRVCREAEFYRRVEARPAVAGLMPRVLGFDAEGRVLVLEDLGTASDYTGVYRDGGFSVSEVGLLAAYLRALHEPLEEAGGLSNREMRELNHAHIFVIPLDRGSGVPLDQVTPGLSQVAAVLQGDRGYCREVERLGREVYLGDGPALVHGDFFPGSLLRTPAGPRVIDPEFGYLGRPEYDAGVFLGHLWLSGHEVPALRAWHGAFTGTRGFEAALMLQLAGVEIMRRLIGYAQLPLVYGLDRKRELLELSRDLVLDPRGTWNHAMATA